MRRTNTFVVVPRSEDEEVCLHRLLDASASLWNEFTFERRQRLFKGKEVWQDLDCGDKYKHVLGAATVRTVRRMNDAAWRSFFELRKKHSANPPGYWGNEAEGRDLRTYLRNDAYTLEWGRYSRIELLVGQDLKQGLGLGYYERPRFEVQGDPNWKEYQKQGRIELYYDEQTDQYRVLQSVTIKDAQLSRPLADKAAALDIGANNLVACTTTTGKQYLYEGRALFERFRETTLEIARLQSLLEEGQHSSHRILRLYARRTKRRDHAQDALVRDLIERLYNEGVATVYVGALAGVLESHWSVETNEKTHNFWAFRAFLNRLACTAEEYGLSVEARPEAWTSQECPTCGSTAKTKRHRDTLICQCGFEGHADLAASETFLRRHQNSESSNCRTRHDVSRQQQTTTPRPMARPVCLKWDDHEWSGPPRSHRPNEEHTNPQVASVERERSLQREDTPAFTPERMSDSSIRRRG
jgi:putative transposase